MKDKLRQEAIISEITDQGVFAQIDGQTYEVVDLASDQVQVGDHIQGLAYEDRYAKAKFQTQAPAVTSDDFGWGEVVDVRSDLGIFVDIGLQDKDIVVSLDDLPTLTMDWPKVDDQVYVKLVIDNKGRFWGQLAEEEDLESLMQRAPKEMMNQEVQARVYRLRLEGALCLTTQGYRAFIHKSEWLNQPRLGEDLKARVINVKGDGSLNLSTLPRAHEVIDDDAMMIKLILEKTPNHFLALHDKSKPADIRNLLGISKGQFKRAVGQLLRQGVIEQEIGRGIYLKAETHDKQ